MNTPLYRTLILLAVFVGAFTTQAFGEDVTLRCSFKFKGRSSARPTKEDQIYCNFFIYPIAFNGTTYVTRELYYWGEFHRNLNPDGVLFRGSGHDLVTSLSAGTDEAQFWSTASSNIAGIDDYIYLGDQQYFDAPKKTDENGVTRYYRKVCTVISHQLKITKGEGDKTDVESKATLKCELREDYGV